MAVKTTDRKRSSRSAVIRFSLPLFERALCKTLGIPERDSVGSPGSICSFNAADLSSSVAGSYLGSELLTKFDDGKKNAAKDKLTWEKFHEAEHLCFTTNQRLSVKGFSGPYEQAILLAKNIASRILGPFSWDAAETFFGWGPGASTRLPRSRSHAAYKYSGHPEATYGNAILAHTAILRVPSWKRELDKLGPGDVGYCKIVSGNRIITVPKNYKTDRTIAIEPDMNMYVQKGIGGLMRQRLLRAGCDLSDQTRNQRLALVGSLSGRLATIDLSMASDTVSRVLVSKFMRSDWLEALEQCRSPFGVLPSGEKIFYQKFSSMGNGFTFELETLIFLSLALAWCHLHGEEVCRVSVYGDDIILPSAVAGSFSGLLNFVGFQVNEKKSYWTGPFRESCGKHFSSGHDISPFFVRRPVVELNDLFLLHNNLFRWSVVQGRLTEFEELLYSLRRLAPAKWREARLPDGYGDGAFIGTNVPLRPCPDGHESWVVDVLAESSQDFDASVPGSLTCWFLKGQADMRDYDRSFSGFLRMGNLRHLVRDGKLTSVNPSRVARKREMKISLPQYPLA